MMISICRHLCNSDHVEDRVPGLTTTPLHSTHCDAQTAHHFAEDRITLVEIFTTIQRDEELRVVRVGCILIGTGHDATMRESQSGMEFVFEIKAVHGYPALARTCLVTRLYHEFGHDAVKRRFQIEAFETELDKIPTGQGCFFGPQFNFDVAQCRRQTDFAFGRRLEIVNRRHRWASARRADGMKEFVILSR